MSLVFFFQIKKGRSGRGVIIVNQWLLAFTADRRCFKLPLANVYDDGRLCNGTFEMNQPDVMAAAMAELTQFENSSWNSDLNNDAVQAGANNMFRFRLSTEGEAPYSQLPIIGNWETHCRAIAPAIVHQVAF
jgi:hypothetical protein